MWYVWLLTENKSHLILFYLLLSYRRTDANIRLHVTVDDFGRLQAERILTGLHRDKKIKKLPEIFFHDSKNLSASLVKITTPLQVNVWYFEYICIRLVTFYILSTQIFVKSMIGIHVHTFSKKVPPVSSHEHTYCPVYISGERFTTSWSWLAS